MSARSGVNDRPLGGRTVLVTGAAGGLGRAYCRAIGAAGAAVVLVDVAPGVVAFADELLAEGHPAAALCASVADPENARAAVDLAINRFGRLDGVVNNAGAYAEGPFWDEDPAVQREIVDSSLMATLAFGTVAGRHFAASGGGAFVNISSGAALGYPNVGAYAAAKAGIEAATVCWALDGAAIGVRANAIAPVARTPLTDAWGKTRVTNSPGTIAPLVVYLLSALAADVTGQFFRFDGEALSVVSPLRFGDVVVTEPRWDVEQIAAVVADRLPIGPVGGEERTMLLPGEPLQAAGDQSVATSGPASQER